MKYKECIKKIGLKNVILYEMFYILEIILNLPYLMLRGIDRNNKQKLVGGILSERKR